jgi:hypothetical protein
MRYLLAILLLASACSVRAQGTSEAILGFNTAVPGGVVGTAGWAFQPATNITVTELGCLADYFANNPYTNLLVGLWGPSGLLASNSISLASTPFDQSLFAPITPVPLSTHSNYVIGVCYPYGSFSLDAVIPSLGGSVSNSIDILSVKLAQTSSGWGAPIEVAGADPGAAFLGPNFRYTGGLPEPSAAALLALGGALLAARRRSRRPR